MLTEHQSRKFITVSVTEAAVGASTPVSLATAESSLGGLAPVSLLVPVSLDTCPESAALGSGGLLELQAAMPMQTTAVVETRDTRFSMAHLRLVDD
jgi:hypothetical protein